MQGGAVKGSRPSPHHRMIQTGVRYGVVVFGLSSVVILVKASLIWVPSKETATMMTTAMRATVGCRIRQPLRLSRRGGGP